MEHLSLFELNKLVGVMLDAHLEPAYWVVAEIGEMRQHGSGHCYLEMVEKEDHKVKAKMRATIWSYTFRNLGTWFERMTGEPLRPGLKILFQASVSFHEVYGLSLNIKDIDAAYTLGERARQRNETLQRLKEDGVWDMNRELSLPMVPQRIAVISSATAAGFGDFTNQLTQNPYGYVFDIKLFQATMQGEAAPASIIKALHQIFDMPRHFDLVVLIRGGGAVLDLDCFDSYELASHVAQFPIPVVTGIGHERDETVVDLVAHTRLKTPTAVAEFLISGLLTYEERLLNHLKFLVEDLREKVDETKEKMLRQLQKLRHAAGNTLHDNQQRLQQNRLKLKYAFQTDLSRKKEHVGRLQEKILTQPLNLIKQQREYLGHLEREVKLADPEKILARGFSITQVNGVLIKNAAAVKVGDVLTTRTKDGSIESTVMDFTSVK